MPEKPDAPGVPLLYGRKAVQKKEREGLRKRETLFLGFFSWECLRGPDAQESIGPRPGVNIQGSRRGHRFFGGSKSLKLHGQAGMVWPERARAEEKSGNLLFDHRRGKKL